MAFLLSRRLKASSLFSGFEPFRDGRIEVQKARPLSLEF
jgi:hypothetical protein